ncbi:MAG: SIR2 family protein [Candidatus Nitrosopolaris sp.]
MSHTILDPELIFLLGAGASIPARISGVQGMVNKFLQKLEGEHRNSYFETTNDIRTLLSEWKIDQKEVVIDIELLLETIERLENRHLDVVPLFYNQKKKVVETFENLELHRPKLSDIIKQFIKSETGKPDIQVDYLKGLLKFMKGHMPLHIFSTNYDICIERFCITNNKTFFDGFFDGKWDPDRFAHNLDRDVLLYKLHGSVTWSRDERGRYTRNEIAITDTEQSQINIVTGEKEIPLISYPGRKLEYFEPTFDLIVELKNRLNHQNLKYIFVVGYSFRDDHIRRLVQYASERNHEFILFLIGPSAHEIYQTNLKHYKDIDFVSGFEGNAGSSERNSSLIGRVIRLPYKFEKIVDVLHDTYLQELHNGIEEERGEINKTENEIPRWQKCLEHFTRCEYFDKVEDIVKKMGDWDKLMKSDYDIYELGWKIIVKCCTSVHR